MEFVLSIFGVVFFVVGLLAADLFADRVRPKIDRVVLKALGRHLDSQVLTADDKLDRLIRH